MDPSSLVTDLTEAELHELRKSDAWLPSESTRRYLLELRQGDVKPSDFPTTSPRLQLQSGAVNIIDPFYRHPTLRFPSGARIDAIRPVITADMVTLDCDGLNQLIKHRWFHAALDMTGRLLTICEQSPDIGSKLTPFTAQLWLTRFVLLKQTQQFDLLERELSGFGMLDYPDVYYEYAPDLYPGRKGSMIPFSMRLLYAELPHYLKRSDEALDRLYFLAAVVERMISNLENGYTEDGSEAFPNEFYQSSSLSLWRRRECKILAICLSIYLSTKDYPSAIETVYKMIENLKPLGEHRFLYGTLGRIYLEFGDVQTAGRMFNEALVDASDDQLSTKIQRLMFNAMIKIGNGSFDEARRIYREVLELDPSNIAAANNQAVCSHYTGQTDNGARMLQALATPSRQLQQRRKQGSGQVDAVEGINDDLILHETLVSNLYVLLESESDHTPERMMTLLEEIARLPGERVAFSAFRINLT